ncbi:gamma subclass chorismate mutase AroQ [Chryseobacterium nematophagum]|uniref:chorismate mutase n=1 Tax=Chryseobacterium nematophagum TaxID=2305228 RepID=A0A3M7LA86_9FLAO|nr:gamma subclass chorismate mutase AroQ [Chryseobacterium nematophagum]RMZ59663.1 gamma subclass chorismate mutase AroQ [Chryseobacterium nematophagum]
MKRSFLILLAGLFLIITACNSKPLQNNDLDNNKEILLRLINKRLSISPIVARSKWNTKAPIDDPAREKIILDSVQAKAKKLGIDENFAKDFFQAQFEAGKIVQRQLHKQWQTQNQGLFDPSPDLANEVRPILDSLTPQLLMELKKIKPNSCSQQSLEKLNGEARKIIASEFNDQVIKTAIKPIENYCKKH